MKVLIVEDETAAYESIVAILKEIDPTIQVLANTESVSQTVKWLQLNPAPDLILMDIHLSDGSAFLIFQHIQVEVPIIFTTAYDEYAIEAFKVNSIDYLLKPIKTSDLRRALAKFSKWFPSDIMAYLSKMPLLSPTAQYIDKLLIPFKDKLLPIELHHVSHFYTTEKNTIVYLRDGKMFPYARTLDQIFLSLNPTNFYRANKQFIIARNEVKNITIWFDSRLLITLHREVPEPIYISKNRASDFKAWIVNGK